MAGYSNYDRIQNKPTPPNGMTQNKLYPPDDGGIQNQPYPPANAGAGGMRTWTRRGSGAAGGSGPGDAWADATGGGGGGGGAPPQQQTYGFPNQRGTNLPWSYQANEPLPTWDGRRPPGIGSGAVPIQTGSPGQHGGSTSNWFDPATGKVTNQYGTITDTSFTGGNPEQWQMLASLAQGSPGGMLDPTQYQEAWRAGQGPSTEVVSTPEARATRKARWDTQRAATLARKGMAPNAAPSAGVSRDPRTGRVLGGGQAPAGGPGPDPIMVPPNGGQQAPVVRQVGSTLTPQDAAWWPDGVLPSFVTPRAQANPAMQTAAAPQAPAQAPTSSPPAQAPAQPAIDPQRMMQLFQALLSQGQPGLAPGATGSSTLDPNMLRQLLASLGTGG